VNAKRRGLSVELIRKALRVGMLNPRRYALLTLIFIHAHLVLPAMQCRELLFVPDEATEFAPVVELYGEVTFPEHVNNSGRVLLE